MASARDKQEKKREWPAAHQLMNDESGLFFPRAYELPVDAAYVEEKGAALAAIDPGEAVALPDAARLRDLVPGKEIADFSQIKIRYLSNNDQYKTTRDVWVSSLFNNIEFYNLNYQETHSISRANSDYDIIIVGGNDSLRTANFLKANADLFGGAPRIVLMCHSDPRRRAQVLNAGFDDVLDCARMSSAECIMRVSALWRRHQLVVQIHAAKADALIALAALTKPEKNLTEAEVRVLTKLSENAGKVISYIKLCDAASKGYQGITLNHLKVLVSGLRKKIAQDWEINSVNSFGYMLSKVKNSEL